MNAARRLTLTALVSLCALVGALACSSVPAQAIPIHHFLLVPSEKISGGVPVGAKAAGGEEAVSGPVGGARVYAMTAAPGEAPGEAGHLWVAEPGRVDEFNASSGEWESQLEHIGDDSEVFGVAVGGSTGEREVYVTDVFGARRAVAAFGPNGKLQQEWTGSDTPEGSFANSGAGSEPAYVSALAVDGSASLADWAKGDVFVGTRGNGRGAVVDVFKPVAGGGEEYVTQLMGTCPVPGATVGGATCEAAEVVPFADSGPRSVAVDAATGDLLVADGAGVDFFEPVGLDEYRYLRRITGIPGRSFVPVGNVAVGGGEGGGDIYVTEASQTGSSPVVYQFNSKGEYLGSLTGTAPTSPFHQLQVVAVEPASGDVYVGDAPVVDAFGPSIVVPDVTTGAASLVSLSSATLNGTVNPLGEGAATCRFVWGTTREFGQAPVACSAGVPEGGVPIEVHSEVLQGLQPDTTYYYRLQATNKNGTDTGEGPHAECEGKPSEDGCFTTAGPGIEEESVANVAATSATLDAEIDPNSSPTSYYFQYGSEACVSAVHECVTVPAPPGVVGSGKGAMAVSQHVGRLAAGALYHYRVVAVSEVTIEVSSGKFETKVVTLAGADQTFTSQSVSAFGLPDGRQWELVSPPDKHGAFIEPINQESLSQAAADGEAISYETNAPTESEPQGYSNNTQVLSVRESGGWVSKDLTIPHEAVTGVGVGEGEEYRAFSEDLSLGALQPFGLFLPSLSPEASEQTPFLRTDFTGGNVGDLCTESCYRPLVTGCPPVGQSCPPAVAENADVPPGTVFAPYESRSIATAYGPKFEGGTPDFSHVVVRTENVALDSVGGNLYEWSGGKLALVSVLPASQGGAAVYGAQFGNGTGSVVRHAISDDGSRVFWTREGTSVLYMRYNAMQPQSPISAGGECTVRADACTIQIGSGYEGASSDGSRVFFSEGENGDLYECEVVEETGGGLGCKFSNLASQAHLVGASEDGSWVYFTSRASDGLYVRHDGVTKLIAVLSSEEAAVEGGEKSRGPGRVSPDGYWLAFMSQRELIPGDITRDALSGELDEEVYLYNAQTEKLVCASCNPTGARPVGELYPREYDRLFSGDGVWGQETWLAANIPGWTTFQSGLAQHQSRYLADGGRLFFNSHDALVPQAVNGTWNVYEYEPPGVGSCTVSSTTFSVRSGGCVGLISAGTSDSESAFLDASESGGDVFFLTKSRLAPQDYDTSIDVYDAHECTSLAPCFPAVALSRPPCTTGDACKPAPAPQPAIFGAPSSETFSGAGNVTPAGSTPAVAGKALTRAQKLARALKACRKKSKRRRAACERQARRAYGHAAKAKKSHKRGGK
jgi:WD40-like Beta Propeller Repeat